ncbi:hypothetical protein EJB05_35829, partial [Eragrostis curvula]
MELPKPRTMAARSLLLLLSLTIAGVFQSRAQLDSHGFISIDCGLPGTASYVDDGTGLSRRLHRHGTNYDISPDYITEQLSRTYHNVRSIPNGTRNCYTLRSLTTGNKYLVRAAFKYGDYDSLNRPPVFDLYVGVNYWKTVNLVDPDDVIRIVEAIVVVPADFVQVCLVNTDSGTPFISGLDLRPLNNSLYPQANATRGLVLLGRFNFGPTNATDVRYPDDPLDRIWLPWIDNTNWTEISTTLTVHNSLVDIFEAPSKVMQTAITPRDASKNIELSWDPKPQPKDPSPGYIANLHFSELQLLPSGSVRAFYVNLNGDLWYSLPFTPEYLYADALFSLDPTKRPKQSKGFQDGYSDFGGNTENDHEKTKVSAIAAIKAKYRVQKNWIGDPCLPRTLTWDGLTCRYAISQPPRITGV